MFGKKKEPVVEAKKFDISNLDKKTILIGLALGTITVAGGIYIYKKVKDCQDFERVRNLYLAYYEDIDVIGLTEKEHPRDEEDDNIINEYFSLLQDISNAEDIDDIMDAVGDLDSILEGFKYYTNVPILNIADINHLRQIQKTTNHGIMTDEAIKADDEFVNPIEQMINNAVKAQLEKGEQKEEEKEEDGNTAVSDTTDVIPTDTEENNVSEEENSPEEEVVEPESILCYKDDGTGGFTSPFNRCLDDTLAEKLKKSLDDWNKKPEEEVTKMLKEMDDHLSMLPEKEQNEYLKKTFREYITEIAVVNNKHLNDPDYVKIISKFDTMIDTNGLPEEGMQGFLDKSLAELNPCK